MAAADLQTQNPEVALDMAMNAAISGRDGDSIRTVAARTAEARLTGPWSQAQRQVAIGATAAIDGRAADAIAAFREARASLIRMGVVFDAATVAIQAVILLPGDPEARAWATESRPLLEELRAQGSLARLDAALAAGEPVSDPARQGAGVGVEQA